jgi:trimeric autotransporter adhesin
MRKALTAALLLAIAQQAAAVSDVFTYQGSLDDAGLPANGSYDLQFTLQGPGPNQAPLTIEDVAVSGGVFTVELNFGAAIASGDYALQIGVRPGASVGAFTVLSPTTPIRPTPQAQVAAIATEAVTVSPNAVTAAGIQDGSVGAADIDSSQVQTRVSGTCPAGNSISAIASDGTVSCQAGSGVTSVATGSGLTGGPITSSGTIAIAEDAVTSLMIEDGAVGAADINPFEVQQRVEGTCPAGSSISAIALDGSVSCETGVLGQNWSLTGNSGTDPSSNFIGTTDAQAFVIRTQNAQALRLEPSSILWSGGRPNTANIIAGSYTNGAGPGTRGVAVLGGGAASGSESVPFGGQPNFAWDNYALVVGGYDNQAGSNDPTTNNAEFAAVIGGEGNRAIGKWSTTVGGSYNRASDDRSIVLGGSNNYAYGAYSVILGGSSNAAVGVGSAIAGGAGNCAGGAYSLAVGTSAKVRPGLGADGCSGVSDSGDSNGDEGTFVWADNSSFSPFVSSGPNQFLVRADGGVLLNTNTLPAFGDDLVVSARKSSGDADADLRLITRSSRAANMYVSDATGTLFVALTNVAAGSNRISVSGGSGGTASLSNGGTWTNASSRTFKNGFAAIDALDVLKRVTDLPITRWIYNGSEEGTHMGPMAEDFKAAFDLAGDGKSIATVDADGVALAAIQGLNQKLEAENAELRRRLDALEARFNQD